MTDYKELVERLRAEQFTLEELSIILPKAAAAIEALQAAEPTERQVVDYCHKRCLVVLEADLFHELKASYGKMPKRGEWLPPNEHRPMWECSRCGWYVDEGGRKDFTYCPNCGAKMNGEQNVE